MKRFWNARLHTFCFLSKETRISLTWQAWNYVNTLIWNEEEAVTWTRINVPVLLLCLWPLWRHWRTLTGCSGLLVFSLAGQDTQDSWASTDHWCWSLTCQISVHSATCGIHSWDSLSTHIQHSLCSTTDLIIFQSVTGSSCWVFVLLLLPHPELQCTHSHTVQY